jgi:hypothetical protein
LELSAVCLVVALWFIAERLVELLALGQRRFPCGLEEIAGEGVENVPTEPPVHQNRCMDMPMWFVISVNGGKKLYFLVNRLLKPRNSLQGDFTQIQCLIKILSPWVRANDQFIEVRILCGVVNHCINVLFRKFTVMPKKVSGHFLSLLPPPMGNIAHIRFHVLLERGLF